MRTLVLCLRKSLVRTLVLSAVSQEESGENTGS